MANSPALSGTSWVIHAPAHRTSSRASSVAESVVTVTAPGTYFVADAQGNVRSATFRIDQQVYKDILKAAVRTYFYQRSGFAKVRRKSARLAERRAGLPQA